jgi:hypothetical protein
VARRPMNPVASLARYLSLVTNMGRMRDAGPCRRDGRAARTRVTRAFMALRTGAAAYGATGPDAPLGDGAVIDDVGGLRYAGGDVRSRKSMTVAALASR